MSQGNVEIVNQGIDAFNRRDGAAVKALTTRDFEWRPGLVRALGGGVYRGSDGIDAYFADLRATFEQVRILVSEYRELGDRVLALGRVEGRGVGSGARVDAPIGIIFNVRGGRISRSQAFLDQAEALNTLGLEE